MVVKVKNMFINVSILKWKLIYIDFFFLSQVTN